MAKNQDPVLFDGTVNEWKTEHAVPGDCLVEIYVNGSTPNLRRYLFRGESIIESCEIAATHYCDRFGIPNDQLEAFCNWEDGRRFGPFHIELQLEAKVLDPRQGSD